MGGGAFIPLSGKTLGRDLPPRRADSLPLAVAERYPAILPARSDVEADVLLKIRSPLVKINNISKRGIPIPKPTLFAFLYLGGGNGPVAKTLFRLSIWANPPAPKIS